MDDVDRGILNEIQTDFPITQRPYLEIAKRLSLSEGEVIDRVSNLKYEGVIRRIGGNFNSRSLDFTSTLCAARVPQEKLDRFVSVVNSYPGVTHNYRRLGEYNVWFTLIAQNRQAIEEILKSIAADTGIEDILDLPGEKTYKIRVDFEL
jgi:DNA-binding Lrp family transcriptional regulator